MRILMYRWKAYNQYDIIQNLKLRGHEVTELFGEMLNYEDDPGFIRKLSSALDADSFDMVFSVNYFPIISDECEKRGILYVSWCCDCPIATMYNESVFNSVNRIFTFDKFCQLEFEEMGAKVYYLPLCGSIKRSTDVIQKAEQADIERFSSEVSFIGSMYNKNYYDEVYDHLPEYLKGYFDAIIKMQLDIYGECFLDKMLDSKTALELDRNFVLAKSDRCFSDLSLVFSTTVLGFKIAQLERKEILSNISKRHEINVYTDDENAFFLRGKNCGTADYWSQAPIIFNKSKINLNLTLRTIQSGIPLRIWDILSAGGFLITNFQPELPLYFENKKDLVYFESKEDLYEKIDYYLSHDEERKAIAENGRRKVMSLHTYKHRFDEMSKIVSGI